MESLRFDRLCINAKSRSRGGHNSSGSLQRDARRNVASSYDRFRRSLSSFVFSLNYTEHITDTHNRNIIEMLLHNPMSQAELVHDINEKGYTHDIAVAVAFSCRLKCFDEINYSVCQKLSGLYLFSVVKFEREYLVNFLRRCPNIKSLTLAYMDLIDADFLCAIFSDGLLPKLEFLEITYASDDAIAAMVSAPYLRKIVFQFPDRCITNDGFKRLVEAGGGKNLDAITASVDRTNPSTTLTKSFLMETLPKFVSKQGNARDLESIPLGQRMRSKIGLSEVKRKLPFASTRMPLKEVQVNGDTFKQNLDGIELNER